jgi:hypothetical protein
MDIDLDPALDIETFLLDSLDVSQTFVLIPFPVDLFEFIIYVLYLPLLFCIYIFITKLMGRAYDHAQ